MDTQEINMTIAYHGSSLKLGSLDTGHGIGKTKGIGLYLSDSAEVARTYAGSNGYVYTVSFDLHNPFEIDFEGSNWNNFDYDGSATSYFISDSNGNELEWFSNLEDAKFAESNYDYPVTIEKDVNLDSAYSTDDIARMAKSEGHDGAIIYNVIDSANTDMIKKPSTVYIIFSSNSIKSVDVLTENAHNNIFMKFIEQFKQHDVHLVEAIEQGYHTIFGSNDKIVYHGGDINNLKSLNKSFRILTPDEKRILPSTGGGNIGLSASTNKSIAKRYSSVFGNDYVLAIKVDPSANIHGIDTDGNGIDMYLYDSEGNLKAELANYDAIVELDKGAEEELRILNSDKFSPIGLIK